MDDLLSAPRALILSEQPGANAAPLTLNSRQHQDDKCTCHSALCKINLRRNRFPVVM